MPTKNGGSEWNVIAGQVMKTVRADTNMAARIEAVKQFREEHGILLPIAEMLPFWRAFRSREGNSDLSEDKLIAFYRELEPTYRKDTRGRKIAFKGEKKYG